MARGFVAGYKMEDISVELYDGSYPRCGLKSEIAFKLASIYAFKEAAAKAGAVLLEPVMKVEVRTPEQFMGDVNGNISSKRGQVEGMGELGDKKVITAQGATFRNVWVHQHTPFDVTGSCHQ
jgi:elongation factor G